MMDKGKGLMGNDEDIWKWWPIGNQNEGENSLGITIQLE